MRVLLVGSGPLPDGDPTYTGFPQLRTAHFRDVIAPEHELELLLLGEDRATESLPWGQLTGVRPQHGDWLARARERVKAFQPDVVVSAGPWEPARVAAAIVGEQPLFVDVPGDPFAEAQAKAAIPGEGDPSAQAREVWGPALTRGDAFSAISGPQSDALLGQLGWLGRLGANPAEHRWVDVIPAAYAFGGLPEQAPRAGSVVALCGGFNTWFDGDTALAGLLQAMARDAKVRVIVTGGGVDGHHTQGFARFHEGALASASAERFHFHGWLPHGALPEALAPASIGLCLNRPGVEPRLGTRTRILFFAHQGMDVIATPAGELSRDLAARGLIHSVPVRDPDALADCLLSGIEARAGALQAHLRQATPERTAAPLLRWLAAPKRTVPGLDVAAEASARATGLQAELAAVHGSPTWRAASRLRGLVRREES